MFAIIETGGKQYRVQPDDIIYVEKLNAKQGETIGINEVLAVSEDDDNLIIGTPYVKDATVEAEVIEHGKDDKIIIYKYKPKKKYRRKQGHRQPFTSIKILNIALDNNTNDSETTETVTEVVNTEVTEPAVDQVETISEESTEVEE